MIKEFKNSIAYVCPYCSSITVKDLNIFSLCSEKSNSFYCDDETACGAANISIQSKKTAYEIIIQCPVCEDNHHFKIKKERFWQENKPLQLNCPESGLGILFIGEHNTILDMVYEQESSLIQESMDLNDVENANLVFEFVEEINHLASKQQISCKCNSKNISIAVDYDSVVFTCRDCANTLTVSITEDELDKMLKASAIVLD